jgi:excisionase family DNA binding protein
MLTVAEAANRLGQDRETIRRWIHSGRLPARKVAGRYMIELRALRTMEDELFPMTKLPDEWKLADDGSPAPNWIAALYRSRRES